MQTSSIFCDLLPACPFGTTVGESGPSLPHALVGPGEVGVEFRKVVNPEEYD